MFLTTVCGFSVPRCPRYMIAAACLSSSHPSPKGRGWPRPTFRWSLEAETWGKKMCRPLSLCQPPRECHEQVTFVYWILDEHDERSCASTKLDTVHWCKLTIIRIIERIWKDHVSSSTDQQDRSGWFGSQKAQTGAAPGATMATKTACFSDHGFPRHLERLESDSAVVHNYQRLAT